MENLTYFQIIFYYIFIPLVLIRWLVNPFFPPWDQLKVKIVCSITILIVTINNYVFCTGNRVYQDKVVMFTINSVPVDEYLRDGLQITLAALWTFLCTRWTIHSLFLYKPSSFTFYLTRYSVIVALILISFLGPISTSAITRLACRFAPIICCVWFVAGQYITRRFFSVGVSILVPSLYFLFVDTIALKNNIWYTREVNSREQSHVELFAYYVIVNGIVAFVSASLDKAKAVIDLYFPRYQLEMRRNCRFVDKFILNVKHLVKGLISDERSLPVSVFEDFQQCCACLKTPGKSSQLRFWARMLSSGKFF